MSPAPHQQKVGRRFSAAAAGYDRASRVQEDVALRVIELVPAGAHPRRVLDVGCGTGRLLKLARARWPAADLEGIDVAEGMIGAARTAAADDARVSFVVGDAGRYRADRPFDLVISSSAMHWLLPFAAGLANVFSQLSTGGYLVAGLMTESTLRELREARDAVAPHKQAPGRLPSFSSLEGLAGTLPSCRAHLVFEQRWEATYGSAQALLRVLHATGVTGGDVSQGEAPLTRRELRGLAEYYDRSFPAASGGVRATFSVGFLVLERL